MKSKADSEMKMAAGSACWSCSTEVAARALFCHGCGAIQPPRPLDHFARLNLPVSYELTRADLERQYFGLQRYFHPDRFAAKSTREKNYSLQHATSLNEAYEILKSSLKRAEYLLQLKGYPVQPPGQETIADPELLMEAMEMREELADAANATAIDVIVHRVEHQIEHIEQALAAGFVQERFNDCIKLALRMRYLVKLVEEAKDRLRRLEV